MPVMTRARGISIALYSAGGKAGGSFSVLPTLGKQLVEQPRQLRGPVFLSGWQGSAHQYHDIQAGQFVLAQTKLFADPAFHGTTVHRTPNATFSDHQAQTWQGLIGFPGQ